MLQGFGVPAVPNRGVSGFRGPPWSYATRGRIDREIALVIAILLRFIVSSVKALQERLTVLRKDLAAALGISGSMVSRLSKRGMPTNDVASARRWRDRHLEPGRMKGVRFEAPKPSSPPPCETATDVVEVFICLALFVKTHGIERYGQALIHLATVMADVDHERLHRRNGEVPQEVWDAWDRLDELYFAQEG